MATTVSQPRPAAVASVLATSSTWVSARRKADGRPFFFVPGSTAGSVYMTDATNCTCPAAQRYAGPCKHSAAVAQHQARQQAAKTQTAPKPARRSYAEMNPVCGQPGCDDDAGRSGFCCYHRPRTEDRPFVNGRIGCEDIFQLNPLAE